jgi:hypothetical protein
MVRTASERELTTPSIKHERTLTIAERILRIHESLRRIRPHLAQSPSLPSMNPYLKKFLHLSYVFAIESLLLNNEGIAKGINLL